MEKGRKQKENVMRKQKERWRNVSESRREWDGERQNMKKRSWPLNHSLVQLMRKPESLFHRYQKNKKKGDSLTVSFVMCIVWFSSIKYSWLIKEQVIKSILRIHVMSEFHLCCVNKPCTFTPTHCPIYHKFHISWRYRFSWKLQHHYIVSSHSRNPTIS